MIVTEQTLSAITKFGITNVMQCDQYAYHIPEIIEEIHFGAESNYAESEK